MPFDHKTRWKPTILLFPFIFQFLVPSGACLAAAVAPEAEQGSKRIGEVMPQKAAEKTPENVPEKSAEKNERASEKIPEKPTEKPTEKLPEKPLVKFTESTEIRPLPGGLNNVYVFNSNSPEMVLENGILLSTFPFDQMAHPECHLNFAFDGNFDLFAHHVTKAESDTDERVLWLGFLVGNMSNKKVRVRVLNGSTYLSQPEAPFITLPDISLNNEGKIYAGPGDRVSDEVLRDVSPTFMPKSIEIPPGQTKTLVALPLPVRKLRPALNGRSLLLKLSSSGPVHIASLAKYVGPEQAEAGPTEEEWIDGLNTFKLGTPRDKVPTEPFTGKAGIIFGRVAGVGVGNQWNATATDDYVLGVSSGFCGGGAVGARLDHIKSPVQNLFFAKPPFSTMQGNPNGRITVLKDLSSGNELETQARTEGKKKDEFPSKSPGGTGVRRSTKDLTIPSPGKAISFPICTVERGTFGTDQIQSAPLLVAYSDTAYFANGNYGITYKINLPLYNPLKESVNVQVLFQTPLKSNEAKAEYYEEPPPRAHFRGTVKVTAAGKTNYWHLVQKQGFDGSKLAELVMPAGSRKKVSLEFIYPPDATPPHMVSVVTIKKSDSND